MQKAELNKISCIIDPGKGVGGLYLGNIDTATNLEVLRKNKIKAVLTVAARTGIFNYKLKK